MSGTDEDWVKAAMTDDAMVVELLVRLHRSPPPAPPPPPPPFLPLKPPALPLEWTVRQRRSKSVSITTHPKKTAHRASPTTPLSWSGATSLSGGSSGGFEESSRPPPLKLSYTTRSKINVGSEKTSSKRSRKKKTLSELKEEENMLIKERRELKREISALRMNLEKQRSTNDNLKRIKLELRPDSRRGTTSVPEGSISDLQKTIACHSSPSTIPLTIKGDAATLQPSTSNDCPQQNAGEPDSRFVLPDLNMPFDEEPVSGGVSWAIETFPDEPALQPIRSEQI